MLRSVAEVSVLTGLSKVSIYNKIKLKEIEKYVVKNKGITYISDEGINLIFKGLNLNDDKLKDLTSFIEDTYKDLEAPKDICKAKIIGTWKAENMEEIQFL